MARRQTNHTSTVKLDRIKIILNLLRLDAERLYIRVKERKNEYLRIYSAERTRTHFSEIFYTRFYDISTDDLLIISEETYSSIESYYDAVENLRWYLGHTEDMPSAATVKVEHFIKIIDDRYILLHSYLKAEYSTYEN